MTDCIPNIATTLNYTNEGGEASFLRLPKDAIERNTVMDIDVMDDSMEDEGIRHGDRLRVQLTHRVRDGDIVWAWIGQKSFFRVYFTDEQGETWLLPRNDAYEAVRITPEKSVQIIGRVIGNIRESMRASYADCQKVVRKCLASQTECHEIPNYKVLEVIRQVAGKISNTRQWYAVFRPMVDKGVYGKNDFDAFVWQVHEAVPTHAHLPTGKELRRMAVDSFAKPVSLWMPHKAPFRESASKTICMWPRLLTNVWTSYKGGEKLSKTFLNFTQNFSILYRKREKSRKLYHKLSKTLRRRGFVPFRLFLCLPLLM